MLQVMRRCEAAIVCSRCSGQFRHLTVAMSSCSSRPSDRQTDTTALTSTRQAPRATALALM